jgi:hypothetical protein
MDLSRLGVGMGVPTAKPGKGKRVFAGLSKLGWFQEFRFR